MAVPVTAVFGADVLRAVPGVDEIHAAEVTRNPRAEAVSLVDGRGDDIGRSRLVELDSIGAAVEQRPNRHAGIFGSRHSDKTAAARNAPLDDLANRVDSRPRQLSTMNLLAQAEYPLRIVAEVADSRDARRDA